MLLSMSLVDSCREAVLTQYTSYIAMTLLVLGCMVLYPQWTVAIIVVRLHPHIWIQSTMSNTQQILLKTFNSWPNVTATKPLTLDSVSSGDTRDQSQDFTSQGIPEENGICHDLSVSSTPRPPQQSELFSDSVVVPLQQKPHYQSQSTSTIELLHSLTSTLSRYCDQITFVRKLPVLKC